MIGVSCGIVTSLEEVYFTEPGYQTSFNGSSESYFANLKFPMLNGIVSSSMDDEATISSSCVDCLPKIISMEPKLGPFTGGTSISVIGTNFVDSNSLSCQFDQAVSVKARWISDKQLVCLSPQLSWTPLAGVELFPAAIAVTNNGINYTAENSSLLFHYHAEIVIQEISPSIQKAWTSFPLSVSGPFIPSIKALYCHFNDTVSPGLVSITNQTSRVLCDVPPRFPPGVILTRLSYNGMQPSSTYQLLRLVPLASVSLYESSQATFWSQNINESMSNSSTQVHSTNTTSEQDTVPGILLQSAIALSLSSQVVVPVLSLSPISRVDQGWIGIQIQTLEIQFTAFLLHCTFVETNAGHPVTIVSSTPLLLASNSSGFCLSPPYRIARLHVFVTSGDVSNNPFQISTAELRYRERISIKLVNPNIIVLKSGKIDIMVEGKHFLSSNATIACKLGNFQLRAAVVNDNEIVCFLSTLLSNILSPGISNLWIVTNAGDESEFIPILLMEPIVVVESSPSYIVLSDDALDNVQFVLKTANANISLISQAYDEIGIQAYCAYNSVHFLPAVMATNFNEVDFLCSTPLNLSVSNMTKSLNLGIAFGDRSLVISHSIDVPILDAPYIEKIYPNYTFDSVSTNVTIVGRLYGETSFYQCSLDSVSNSVREVQDLRLINDYTTCAVNPLPSSTYHLSIVSKHHQWKGLSEVLNVFPTPRFVLSNNKLIGNGAHLLLLQGANLQVMSNWRWICWIQEKPAYAVFYNSTHIGCYLPQFPCDFFYANPQNPVCVEMDDCSLSLSISLSLDGPKIAYPDIIEIESVRSSPQAISAVLPTGNDKSSQIKRKRKPSFARVNLFSESLTPLAESPNMSFNLSAYDFSASEKQNHQVVKIRSIKPSSFPLRTRSKITVVGWGLYPSVEAMCRFGELYVTTAHILNASHAFCYSPVVTDRKEALQVPFFFRIAATDSWIVPDSTEKVEFFPSLLLYNSRVSSTVIAGITKSVAVAGTWFRLVGTISSVESPSSSCSMYKHSEVKCKNSSHCEFDIPQDIVSGKFMVKFSLNQGDSWETQFLPIVAISPLRIEEIVVQNDWKLNRDQFSIVVYIHGSQFSSKQLLYQINDNDAREARVVNSSVMACEIPMPIESAVKLKFSQNGGKTWEPEVDGIVVKLPPLWKVHQINPVIGDSSTIVSIHFINVPENQEIFCHWGNESFVFQAIVQKSIAKCAIPQNITGSITLSISMNSIDFVVTDFSFYCVVAPLISSRYPLTVHQHGGSKVTFQWTRNGSILPESWNRNYALTCRFGSFEVGALSDPIDDSKGSCFSPAFSSPSVIPWSVNYNGVKFHHLTDSSHLTVIPDPVIHYISPTIGSEETATIVNVYGDQFVNSPFLSCKFGHAESVLAKWISVNEIICIAHAQARGSVFLTLSNNGYDFSVPSARIFFNFKPNFLVIQKDLVSENEKNEEPPFVDIKTMFTPFSAKVQIPILLSIAPSYGVFEGNTWIHVRGIHFPMHQQRISCSFGKTLSPAITVNSTLLLCPSPSFLSLDNSMTQVEFFLAVDQVIDQKNVTSIYEGVFPLHFTYEEGKIKSTAQPPIEWMSLLVNDSTECLSDLLLTKEKCLSADSELCQDEYPTLNWTLVTPQKENVLTRAEFDSASVSSSVESLYSKSVILQQSKIIYSRIATLSQSNHIESLINQYLHFQQLQIHYIPCEASRSCANFTIDIEQTPYVLTTTYDKYLIIIEHHPVLRHVSPNKIVSGGGQKISFSGSEFQGESSYHLYCLLVSFNGNRSFTQLPRSELIFDDFLDKTPTVDAVYDAFTFNDTNGYCFTSPLLPGTRYLYLTLSSMSRQGLLTSSLSSVMNISKESLPIVIYPTPQVESIYPKNGQIGGGNTVFLYGANFFQTSDLYCIFISNRTESVAVYNSSLTLEDYVWENQTVTRMMAYVLNESCIQCLTPPGPINRVGESVGVTVKLTYWNSSFVTKTGSNFMYENDIDMVDIFPDRGPWSGGTRVTVTLRSGILRNGSGELQCWFGEGGVVSATAVSPSTAECLSPALPSGTLEEINPTPNSSFHLTNYVPIRLVERAKRTLGNAKTFAYLRPPRILSIIPPLVHESNIHQILLQVDAIPNNALHILCMFTPTNIWQSPVEIWNIRVLADRVALDLVSCHPPAYLLSGDYNVSISMNNGSDFGPHSYPIRVLPRVVILQMGPLKGLFDVETQVHITGSLFRDTGVSKCKFGSLTSPATVISETEAVCNSPVRSGKYWNPFTVEIFYSSSGVDYEATSFNFTYVRSPVVYSIQPMYGWTRGHTRVSIVGDWFDNSSSHILFGDVRASNIIILNQSHIVLDTPSHSAGTLFVRAMYQSYKTSILGPAFHYIDLPTIDSIVPNEVAAFNPHTLEINGRGFTPGSGISCRFNNSHESFALWINPFKIRCKLPSLQPSVIAVEVSNTAGNDWIGEYDSSPSQLNIQIASKPVVERSFQSINTENIPAEDIFPRILDASTPLEGLISQDSAVDVTLTLEEPLNFNHADMISSDLSCNFQIGFHQNSSENEILSEEAIYPGVERYQPVLWRENPSASRNYFISALKVLCPIPNEWIHFSRNAESAQIQALPEYASVYLKKSSSVSNIVRLRVFSSIRLLSISPEQGLDTGGTRVAIAGIGFLPSILFHCRFDQIIVPATYISSSQLECVTPRHFPRVVIVEVSEDANSWTHSGLNFEFVHGATVWSLYPAHGTENGNTRVVIRGTGFYQPTHNSSILCRFGNENSPVVARFVSTTEVTCITPPKIGKRKRVAVEVSFNMQTFTDSKVYFMYDQEYVISSVYPAFVDSRGVGEIFIYGLNFRNPIEDLVRNEGRESEEAISKQNGLNSNSYDRFYFPLLPQKQQFSHLIICRFVAGGDMGFSDYLFPVNVSNFEDSKGVYISSHLVRCLVPPLAIGTYFVSLSFNGGLDFASTGKVIISHIIPEIQSYYPKEAYRIESGTLVSIFGGPFKISTRISCVFHNHYVVATVIRENALLCLTPSSIELGTVSLHLDIDGVATGKVSFTFLTDPSLDSIYPSRSLLAGQISIMVRGNSFANSSSLQCKFGESVVNAVYLSHQLLVCPVPSRVGDYANSSLIVPFGVSNNGHTFITKQGITFEYLAKCPIGYYCPGLQILPCSNGTSCSSAGLISSLSCEPGTFQPQYGQISCLPCPVGYFCPDFGTIAPVICKAGYICDNLGLRTPWKPCPAGHACLVGTKTEYVLDFEPVENSTDYNFSPFSPIHSKRKSYISDSDNLIHPDARNSFLSNWHLNNETGQVSFVPESRSWQYIERPYPEFGYYQVENPPTGFNGTHFSNTQHASANRIWFPHGRNVYNGSRPFLLAERPFPCPVGHFCLAGVATLNSALRNSSTPQLCILGYFCPRGSVSALGSGACPSGFYCPHPTNAIPCKVGHYCPNVGNVFPLLCTPGTYNPFQQRASCFACPLGHICPQWGMLEPIICPAGYVCDEEGLPDAVVLCPEGFYCEAGTATRNISLSLPKDLMNLPYRGLWIGELKRLRYRRDGTGSYATPIIPPITYADAIRRIRLGQDVYGSSITGNKTMDLLNRLLHSQLSNTELPHDARQLLQRFSSSYISNVIESPEDSVSSLFIQNIATLADIDTLRLVILYSLASGASAPTYQSILLAPLKPIACFPGTFCLGGVASNVTLAWSPNQPIGSRSPQICAEGTYCRFAVGSSAGSGRCFPGHYCPPGSEFPTQAPIGTYAPNYGNIVATPCLPGTFAPISAHEQCRQCPAGHACSSFGTFEPSMCPPGKYRSILDGIECRDCSFGTFTPLHGSTDISECSPCPSGRVCGSEGLSTLADSVPCPEGFTCGEATTIMHQLRHPCPAGHFCFEETDPDDQTSHLCEEAHFCTRGTSGYRRKQNKCAVDYYCPKGTTSAFPEETKCPDGTTSKSGSSRLVECQIGYTAICDKLESEKYLPSLKYHFLDTLLTTTSDRESRIVVAINPVNESASSSFWRNDTADIIQLCPNTIVFGTSNITNISIVGNNFWEETRMYCDFEVMSQKNLLTLVNATSEINPQKHLHKTESFAIFHTEAVIFSKTRAICPLPLEKLDKVFTENSLGQQMWVKVYLYFLSGNSISWKSLSILPNMTASNYSSYLESFNQICIPLQDSNDDPSVFDSYRQALRKVTVKLHDKNNPGVVFNSTLDYSAVAENGVQLFDFFQGSIIPSSIWDMSRNVYKWFESRALSLARVQFDFSHLPRDMVYQEHYRIAIFVDRSVCHDAKCDEKRNLIPDLRQNDILLDTIPCKQPLILSNWFLDLSVNKHQLLNISLLALEDLKFRIEIQILYGLYSSSSAFFRNSTSVEIFSPSRAYSTGRLKSPPHRVYPPNLSTQNRKVLEEYSFVAIYQQDYAFSISQPLNLPPRFDELERGRVLVLFNSSVEAVVRHQKLQEKINNPTSTEYKDISRFDPNVPWIVDELSEVNRGPGYWLPPFGELESEINRYREIHHESYRTADGTLQYSFQRMLLPYVPYLSNCIGYDSYIPIFALFEDNSCELPETTDVFTLVPERRFFPPIPHVDEVQIVGANNIFQQPIADICSRQLQCRFEEDITQQDVTARWFEADDGTELFQLLRKPIPMNDIKKGGIFIDEIMKDTGQDAFIPVTIDRSAADNMWGGSCTLLCMPRRITFEVGYYQMTQNEKRVISATLIYDEFDRDGNNTDYALDVLYYPLDWLQLVIAFAFERGTFIMIFCLVGAISLIACMVVWLINKIVYSRREVPKFRFLSLLSIVTPGPFIGVMFMLLPMVIVVAFIDILFRGDRFTGAVGKYVDHVWFLDNIIGHYTEKVVDRNSVLDYRQSRIGVAFLTCGLYLIVLGSTIFIPKKISRREREVDRSGNVILRRDAMWRPTMWKRSLLILISIIYVVCLTFLVELSYWKDFGSYIWFIIVALKVTAILMPIALEAIFKELLLLSPFITTLAVISSLVTLGSDNFQDFLLAYAIEFAMLVAERIYVGPAVNSFIEVFQQTTYKIKLSIKSWLFAGRTLTLEEEMQREALETSNPSAILQSLRKKSKQAADAKDMAKSEGSVEPILDAFSGYANDTLAVFFTPLYIILFIVFREEIKIPDLYGIKEQDMEYYLWFSVVIIFFQLASDMFIHNTVEIVHGWKIHDYLVYTRYRFLQRESRWKGNEDHVDECIDENMQTLDKLCFSSQYYFMTMIHSSGIIVAVLGLEIQAHTSHNLFGDPATLIIVPLMIIICFLLQRMCLRIADLLNIWKTRSSETNWHGDGANMTTLPGFDELDRLKGDELELFLQNQRMSKDTFRYKFIDFNREWLLAQLPAVLTPRTLRRSRPYLISQFRRVLGENEERMKKAAADLAMKDDDLDERFGSVTVPDSARIIVKIWLSLARRRMRLKDVVRSIIAGQKLKQCEICSSTDGLSVQLSVPLDELGDRFENDFPDMEEFDQVKWKEYFTSHERFQTVCFKCEQEKEAESKQSKLSDMQAQIDRGVPSAIAAAATSASFSKASRLASELDGSKKSFGPIFLSDSQRKIIQSWLRQAKLSLWKRSSVRARPPPPARGRMAVAAEVMEASSRFRGARFRVTAASKAIGLKWLQLARFHITTGKAASGK